MCVPPTLHGFPCLVPSRFFNTRLGTRQQHDTICTALPRVRPRKARAAGLGTRTLAITLHAAYARNPSIVIAVSCWGYMVQPSMTSSFVLTTRLPLPSQAEALLILYQQKLEVAASDRPEKSSLFCCQYVHFYISYEHTGLTSISAAVEFSRSHPQLVAYTVRNKSNFAPVHTAFRVAS